MGKRKSDGELVKFVWKRNVEYDVSFLSEVETRNPYAFRNQKVVWEEVAKKLQGGSLNMKKVTFRSCRDRVTDLLKTRRQKERRRKAA